MNCPACGTFPTQVIRSIPGEIVRRRHQCRCGARWSSLQKIEKGSLVIGTSETPSNSALDPPVIAPSTPTNSGWGVGGDLPSGSGSSSGSRSDLPSEPISNPERARVDGKRWNAERWKKLFGYAWSEAYNTPALPWGGPAESKAVANFGDIIDALSDTAALAAQDRAATMFEEFLGDRSPSVVRARHPWSWFVTRFPGLLVPAKTAALPGRNGKAEAARIAVDRWTEKGK